MNITIIGTGFVGVVSAAVYASFGNNVIGLDIDERKVQSLRDGKVPFYEPDLEKLLVEQQASGNLHFTTSYEEAIKDADVIFIAVGTPSTPEGQADLKYVLATAQSMAPFLKDQAIVVVKSTVPPGTLEKVSAQLDLLTKNKYYVASVPEFLREGCAVDDTLHPDRVIIGARDQFVFETLEELHKPLKTTIVKISPESAQMAKYSANAYLALRITFANQIADLCEKNGADIEEVIYAIGLDNRIGSHYWYPGFGYGGSCFPKDVKEIAAYSRSIGEGNNIFNKINELNENRIPRLLTEYGKRIGGWQGKKVAVLGLAFKPNTDDMREAPSLKVIPFLNEQGATVIGYDPRAEWKNAEWLLPKDVSSQPNLIALNQVDSITTAIAEADVILALIEWKDIIDFDFADHKSPANMYFIDARNQFDKEKLQSSGFTYIGVGR